MERSEKVGYRCATEEHRGLSACLAALEGIHTPSDVPAERLAAEVPCIFARLKHRIIRLRRGGRGDWPAFVEELRESEEPFLERLDTRWLVSICDTVADYGTAEERGSAACISLLANWEKLSQTQRLAAGVLEAPGTGEAPAAMQEPLPLWDGMTSMILTPGANVVSNLFERLGRLTRQTPFLHRVLLTILSRMRQDRRGTLACLDRIHPRGLFHDALTGLASGGSAAATGDPGARPVAREERRQVAMLEALANIAVGVDVALQQQEQHAGTLQRQLDEIRAALDGGRGVPSAAPADDALPDPPDPPRSAAVRPSRPDRPVFVVGCAKSGTTLLGLLLAEHPAVGPRHPHRERHGSLQAFLDALLQDRVFDVVADEMEHKWVWERYFPAEGVTLNLGREQILPGNPLAPTATEGLIAELCRNNTRPRLLVKHPANTFRVHALREIFPEAKIVAIHRDGREVVASWGRKHDRWNLLGGYAKAIRTLAAKWSDAVSHLERHRQALGIDTVRYEDLVADPAATLRRVLACCELDWPAGIYEGLRLADRGPRWRQRIPEAYHALVESETAVARRQLGYGAERQPVAAG